MHNAVDTREPLVELAMDVSFDEATWSIGVDGRGILDSVLDNVAAVGNEGRGEIARHEEVGAIVRVSNAQVTVCVQHSIVVQDM